MYADTQIHMQSDDALIRFNQVMQMQTFALSDDVWHLAFRQKFNEWEQSKTRLVRVDLPINRARSALENSLNHFLRKAWQKWTRRWRASPGLGAERAANKSPQNIIRATRCIVCLLVALLAAAILVVPLLLLSDQRSNASDLLTIGLFIVIFCFAVSFSSGSSALATMGATAAYAAVLVVFISSNS